MLFRLGTLGLVIYYRWQHIIADIIFKQYCFQVIHSVNPVVDRHLFGIFAQVVHLVLQREAYKATLVVVHVTHYY
jgi:hypothetical protein